MELIEIRASFNKHAVEIIVNNIQYFITVSTMKII
jgi:hypothetical protein